MNFQEKRDAMRMNVDCDIYCKLPEQEQLHKALCLTLSASGVSFICGQPFDVGKRVEICIFGEAKPILISKFFVSIVRYRAIEDGNFEMGAKIQLPKDTTVI